MNLFDLPVWPAADVWEMIPEHELKALADDIAENGQRYPIVVYVDGDGEPWLLDGRNRLAACQIAGIEPEWETFDGGDPDRFVLSSNAYRRNQSQSQKAMAVARIVTTKHGGDRRSRQAATLPVADSDDEVTQDDAAQIAGVSVRLVRSARFVLVNAPDLVDAVRFNTIGVAAAEKEARRRIQTAETELAMMRAKTIEHPDLWEDFTSDRRTFDEVIQEIDDRRLALAANAGSAEAFIQRSSQQVSRQIAAAVESLTACVDTIRHVDLDQLAEPDKWRTDVERRIEAAQTAVNHLKEMMK